MVPRRPSKNSKKGCRTDSPPREKKPTRGNTKGESRRPCETPRAVQRALGGPFFIPRKAKCHQESPKIGMCELLLKEKPCDFHRRPSRNSLTMDSWIVDTRLGQFPSQNPPGITKKQQKKPQQASKNTFFFQTAENKKPCKKTALVLPPSAEGCDANGRIQELRSSRREFGCCECQSLSQHALCPVSDGW